jgi:Xaa-Pro aminopeptidase
MRRFNLRGAILVCCAAASAAAQSPTAPISDTEYLARRDALVARLPSDAVVIAFGERDEIGFPAFFQNPNFRYLTGLDEPNAVLLLTHGRGSGTSAEGAVFRQARTPSQLMFNGPLEDAAALTRRTGLAVRPLQQLAAVVDSLLGAGRPLYLVSDTRPYGFVVDTLTRGWTFAAALRRRTPGAFVRSADTTILALRARKSPAEQALVRRAASITSASVDDAIRAIAPGQHEYDVQARIEAGFRSGGGDPHPGFATNVSAGVNSTAAHHRAGDALLTSGALALMDVGASFHGYAADVTRTVPVSGTFSPAQREIYQLVRDGQAAAERAAVLGAPIAITDDSAFAVIARGLARLGLVEAADATFDPPWPERCARDARACRQASFFFFHSVSHGVGLDVHDPVQATYAAPSRRTIQPGDVFTIEPGIYVNARYLALLADTPKNRAFIAKARAAIGRYDGIGVRIEDDFLATTSRVDRITTSAREIPDIERLMQRKP